MGRARREVERPHPSEGRLDPGAHLPGPRPGRRAAVIAQLREFEHTKIVASHDLDLVDEVCRRTIVLEGGAVAADGPTDEVLARRDVLARARLEPPLRLQACPRCGAAG